MRKSVWLALVVVVGVASCADTSARPPRPRPALKQRASKQQPPGKQQAAPAQKAAPDDVVVGTGKNETVAREQATARARDRVEELLRKRFGEGGWKPREHRLEMAYLQEMGVVKADGEARPDQAVVVVRYKVALTDAFTKAVQMDVVEGFGRAAAAAREQAAAHARDRVRDLLIERYGQGGWSPPERLLELELLERHRVVALDGEPAPETRLGPERAFVARYRVGLTDSFLKELQTAARGERMQDRHAVLLRVLAGAIVLLLVTTGYLRLEEMTRGYATALLRGAAAAIVLLAGIGLWLTF